MSTLDRGRAHDILVAQEWLSLPVAQRESALLASLEDCIEADPEPRPTLHRDARALLNPSLRTILVGLIVWDLTGPIWRLGLQISHGQPIDLLPFFTLLLGGFALWRYLRTPHPRTDR
jgi:hypothetical protein